MGWEKSDDSAMKHVTTTENMLGEPGSLRVLPVELLEKIVGFMIVAVELKNTTALRLTSKSFNQEVVKAFFQDGHITASTFRRAPRNTYITYINWKLKSPSTKEMEMQVIIDAAVKMYQRSICLRQQPSVHQRETYAKILFRSVADLASARGGELNLKTQDGPVQEAVIVQAAFILAAAMNDTITMRQMLKCGANIDDTAKHLAPALWTACREGAEDSVDVLLDLGADIHCGRADTHCGHTSSEPFEVLHSAIREGRTQIAHQLFEHCEYNKTPTEQAYLDGIRNSIKYGHDELAKAIFEAAQESIRSGSDFHELIELEDGYSEADYFWTNSDGYHSGFGDADLTMFMYPIPSAEESRISQSGLELFKQTCVAAIRCGNSKALAAFHENSMTDNLSRRRWAKHEGLLVFLAAKYGQIACMETLFNVSKHQDKFDAWLAIVVFYRRHDMAKLLLESGVDVNFVHLPVRGQKYRTALTIAAHNNDCKMLQILLDRGVDFGVQVELLLGQNNEWYPNRRHVPASEPQGLVALYVAYAEKNDDAVNLLLRAGARYS